MGGLELGVVAVGIFINNIFDLYVAWTEATSEWIIWSGRKILGAE